MTAARTASDAGYWIFRRRAPDALADRMRGFHQGLKDAGFVERENVAIEYRWAENQRIDCQSWCL